MECEGRAQKLDMDFTGPARLVDAMDENDDRVAEICTRIGALMEDASVEALTIGRLSHDHQCIALERLSDNLNQMKDWLADAKALLA